MFTFMNDHTHTIIVIIEIRIHFLTQTLLIATRVRVCVIYFFISPIAKCKLKQYLEQMMHSYSANQSATLKIEHTHTSALCHTVHALIQYTYLHEFNLEECELNWFHL